MLNENNALEHELQVYVRPSVSPFVQVVVAAGTAVGVVVVVRGGLGTKGAQTRGRHRLTPPCPFRGGGDICIYIYINRKEK